MKTKSIALKDIVEDDDVLVRSEINSDHVEDLFEAFKKGEKIPPIIVFDDEKSLILADGRHRFAAARKCKLDRIEAEVHEGSKRDAILFACGVNATHGLRRTNDDKRRAVLKLLMDQEWSKWSDGKIAKNCAVTQVFVSKVREELSHNGYDFPEVRIGLNDKKYNASKKKTGKKTDTNEHTDENDANDDDTENTVENDKDEKDQTKTEEAPSYTDGEIMEVRAAIFNLKNNLDKIDHMVEKKKVWPENRIAKVKTIKETIDQNLIIFNKFLMKLFD